MEEIKQIFKNIEKCMCLYFSGELTFDEAFDESKPYWDELFYIRHKEVIDKWIEGDIK